MTIGARWTPCATESTVRNGDRMGQTHEVRVLCDCDDVELCTTEVYVSDIRVMQDQFMRWLDQLRDDLRALVR